MKSLSNIIAACILSLALGICTWVLKDSLTGAEPNPVTDNFVAQVREAFPGNVADRAIKRAICEQLILSLQADQDLPHPKLKTTADLGNFIEQVQYYRTGRFSPEEYAEFNKLVGDETLRRLQIGETPEPMTPARYQAMIQILTEVAEALK